MIIKSLKKYFQDYYKVHCTKFLKKSKLYYKTHNKERKIYDTKYRKLHKEQRKQYDKIRYQTHKKELNEQTKLNRLKHKKHYALYLKNYQKKYHNKLYKRLKQYMKIKRRTDINFKIKQYLRTRIWSALKGLNKSKTTIQLLGCSIKFLRKHLENQFTKGMNWKNYGKWEIDHIKPCAKFDLSKASEQRKCFNYTNLQPLWKKDNRKKRDNYDY